MRVPSVATRRGGLRLNLTPLIDVIFNLIIFFLAASHFARNEPVEPVELPTATPRDTENEPPRRVSITIAPGPRFLISGQEQERAVVEAMIAAEAGATNKGPLEVRIRSDHTVPFGEVEPLLIAAAKAGVSDVKFAVTPRARE